MEPFQKCDQCGKFSSNIVLKPDDSRLGILCTVCVDKLQGRKFKLFQCHLCGKSFNDKSGLKQHEKAHFEYYSVTCKECGKHISRASNLKEHMKIHTCDSPFSCHFCGKLCVQSGNLKIHLRTHTGERPFPCDHCEKTFMHSNNLTKHHQKVHKGLDQYICKECDLTFSHASTLRAHKRTHSDPISCPCHECGKLYADKHSLRVHIKKLHKQVPKITAKEKDARKYTCDQCGKILQQLSDHEQHRNSHISVITLTPRWKDPIYIVEILFYNLWRCLIPECWATKSQPAFWYFWFS